MAKKGIKHLVVEVPKDLVEATQFIADLAEEQRAINQIEATLNKAVERLTTQALEAAEPHQEKKSQLVEGLFVFATSQREHLTQGGKRKTIELATGTLGWRTTPPAVHISNIKKVIALLRKLDLSRFIRTKEEIDKEQMLKEPETVKGIKGVSIGQREEFMIKPSAISVEIVAKKKTKVIQA